MTLSVQEGAELPLSTPASAAPVREERSADVLLEGHVASPAHRHAPQRPDHAAMLRRVRAQ